MADDNDIPKTSIDIEKMADIWEKQIRLAQLQESMRHINGGNLPVVVKCPTCNEEFRVDIPVAEFKRPELPNMLPAMSCKEEVPHIEYTEKGPHACVVCGRLYNLLDQNVIPVWHRLSICSKECFMLFTAEELED